MLLLGELILIAVIIYKTPNMRSFLLIPILLLPVLALAQNRVSGGVSSYFCGFCHKGPYKTYQEAVVHTCAIHNYLCAPAVPSYTGPSPAELKRKREEKDLREASDDAVDKGVDCYNKRNWTCAIRWFRESLEYDPDNEDARYNLSKAIDHARQEEQELIRKAIVEKRETTPPQVPADPYASLNEKCRQYMKEADRIVVPPPSWESMIQMQAQSLRMGHQKENVLLVGANTFVTAFDIVSSTPATAGGKLLKEGFKIIVVGAKATIAAQQEADIVVFTRNATYERMITILKDPQKGPNLAIIMKLLNENKPVPTGADEELVRLARACHQPAQGTSSVRLMMNAMLSPEAKAAFVQTVNMELIDRVSGKFRELVGTTVQNRFRALREVNEKITEGHAYLKSETNPLNQSLIAAQLSKLEEKIAPVKEIPEHLFNMLSQFEEIKKTVAGKKP